MADERDELVIWTDDDFEVDPDAKGGWNDTFKGSVGRLRPVKLDPAIVETQMAKFVKMVGGIFHQANTQVPPESGLSLQEVEIAVKINGKGQVQLIAGAEAGAEGGITLKFKRSSKGNG